MTPSAFSNSSGRKVVAKAFRLLAVSAAVIISCCNTVTVLASSDDNDAKAKFVEKYLEEVEKSYENNSFWKDLLEPLQIEELKWFQILACQIAGEMEDLEDDGSNDDHHNNDNNMMSTCAPLRVAAMEYAYEWEKDTNKWKSILSDGDDDATVQFADIALHNLRNPSIKNKVWTPTQLTQQKITEPALEETSDEKERMMALINFHSFSTPRHEFVKQTDKMLARIEESTTKTKDLSIIRQKLEKRKSQIERGKKFALSAMVMINKAIDSYGDDPNKEVTVNKMLRNLVAGTVNHGNLSSLHIWQILLNIIPELKLKAPMKGYGVEEQTCESPWADLCPPFETKRAVNGRSVVIPPIEITSFMQAFCTQKQSEPMQPGVCVNAPPLPGDEEGADDFPSDIADGYFGYTIVQARSEDDIVHSVAAAQRAAVLESATLLKL